MLNGWHALYRIVCHTVMHLSYALRLTESLRLIGKQSTMQPLRYAPLLSNHLCREAVLKEKFQQSPSIPGFAKVAGPPVMTGENQFGPTKIIARRSECPSKFSYRLVRNLSVRSIISGNLTMRMRRLVV